jgi:hypothetical protein
LELRPAGLHLKNPDIGCIMNHTVHRKTGRDYGHEREVCKMWKSLIVFIGMVFISTMVAAQEKIMLWNFDADKPDSVAKGFTGESGDWKVVADPTAPTQPNALAQVAKSSGSTFNLVLVEGSGYKDPEVSVRMKAVAGKEDQGGGIVWRAMDSRNYYVARYNPLEDNYRVYKVVNGRRSEFKSARIAHSDGWHTLMVRMKGDRIECYYDGKKYLDLKDSTFKGPGKVGLWTKADAQSLFDDLTVIGQ